MAVWEYDNLPETLHAEALPEELFEEAFDAFSQALESRECLAKEIKAAYVYDRKGYLSTDEFGGVRNKSYSSNNDDVVLQVTVRVPNPRGRAPLNRLDELETVLTERRLKSERERLEAEIAAEETAAVKAKQSAEQKRGQLRVVMKSLNGETK